MDLASFPPLGRALRAADPLPNLGRRGRAAPGMTRVFLNSFPQIFQVQPFDKILVRRELFLFLGRNSLQIDLLLPEQSLPAP